MRYVEELLHTKLHSKLSDRTRRRYRSETPSEPHADTLIQMSVEHYARYSDLLRTDGHGLHDRGRFSLEAMLKATRLSDLLQIHAEARIPTPSEVWDARRRELGEYGALFALKFPKPSLWGDRVVRIGDDTELQWIEPRIRAGSWMALEELRAMPDARRNIDRRGWARPLFALRRGVEAVFGYLDHDGDTFTLGANRPSKSDAVTFGPEELPNLRRVCGALIPM
jgi:hypothetical protein